MDPLLSWAPFFYGFGPGLFVIKILADWWKLRVYFPLRPYQETWDTIRRRFQKTSAARVVGSASLTATARVQADNSQDQVEASQEDLDAMSYGKLRAELESLLAATQRVPTNTETLDLIEAEYAEKAETRYHIHHFVLGIPLMFFSWGLFVYEQGWWALIIAGTVAALFLSELKELITQKWQP